MPDLVPPMLVSTGSGQPPNGPDWVVELAWTGHRCVAYVEPGRRTRLLSANNVSMSAAYPELAAPLERRSPPGGMVLDGTLVARGEEHAPRARLLKRRSARYRPSEEHIRAVPVDFQVADLLWLDGHSTIDLPYRDRRLLLEGLDFDAAPVWTTSPLPVSELDTMLRIADAKGVDALHARHLGSRYKPGGRSPLWVRVPVPRVREVVIGGWTPTDASRPEVIASLLLGVPTEAGLRYVGRVGVAGDQRRQVARLRTLRRADPPFADQVPGAAARHAIWVQPRLVGLVEFTGWVAGGRLRLPLWRGLADRSGVDLNDTDPARWAGPPQPPPQRPAEPAPPTAQRVPAAPVPAPRATEPAAGPDPAAAVHTRRLEQHFVYNALNTIAALIRTDPSRARELLFGFADLSRAADQPGDATSTLGQELDAVRGYLQLEQARFGKRLQVQLDVAAGTESVPVRPLTVLEAVRATVQQWIEPRPEGGELRVLVRATGSGCEVTVSGGDADPVTIALPAAGVTVAG
ncbi:MAG TPA: histidine kinase [Pseudonocardia sp.]|nr:histidine kinase [Pseudonocardia sp.]